MGSSKTAQALMTKYNYEQKGFRVLLLKPILDDRDFENGEIVVKSRIGLSAPCVTFNKKDNLYQLVADKKFLCDNCVVIIDEAQFCTKDQIDELHDVAQVIPVLCYGLLTNFKTELFEGSKRLVEAAESLMEIKSVCECGKKATISARFSNGKLITDGEEIVIGADDMYKGVCYSCYKKLKNI